MSTPAARFTLLVELTPSEGDNAQQTVEWIQKNFDFYHPRLNAKVSSKVAIHAAGETALDREMAEVLAKKSERAAPQIDHSLL